MPRSFDSVFYGAAGGEDLPSDDEFNRVSFLSHFDGANNGVNNVFDDGSTSNHTITDDGNVTQGSFGPFARPDGEWSNYFDGTGDYLSTPSQGTLAASANWCVEAYFYCTGTTSGTYRVMSSNLSTDPDAYFLMRIRLGQYNFYTDNVDSSLVGTAAFNAWTHIAMTKSGTTVRAFVNGVKLWEATDNGTTVIQNLIIGWGYGSDYFPGFISNARFVNGSSVYTSAFTPPTAPLTAITNTTLLTCQSNRFVDKSASPLTLTPTGDTAVSAFGPFLTDAVYDPAVNGASAYFDGSDDFLSFSHASDFAFGTGDFTIEWWSWGGTGTGNAEYIYQGTSASQQYHQLIESGGSGILRYYPTAGSNPMHDTGWGDIVQNAWTHYAVARTSGTTNLYKNGVRVLTASGSPSNSNIQTITARIGASTNGSTTGSPWLGYITDFRIVKGTGVYTGTTYTIPTAPLTAITNTKLLLNMQDGQAIDSAAQNNLNFKGTGKLSTGQAKFGDTSLFMDGNSDGVYISAAPVSTIWTVEQWIYPTRFYSGSGNYDRIWADGTANSDSLACVLWGNDDGNLGKIRLYNDDSLVVGTSTAVSLNTWTHLAIVSSGSTTKIFLDGTQRGTTNSASNLKGRKFTIGYMGTSGYFGGYIDEFRTSLMARYTSNFTSPAEPFADKGE